MDRRVSLSEAFPLKVLKWSLNLRSSIGVAMERALFCPGCDFRVAKKMASESSRLDWGSVSVERFGSASFPVVLFSGSFALMALLLSFAMLAYSDSPALSASPLAVAVDASIATVSTILP